MAQLTSANKKLLRHLYRNVSFVAGFALLVLGFLVLWGGTFATAMVHDELAAQKIYFPQKGSANFSADEFPDLQQYAGQLVDSGDKARAYANGYIGRHLEKVASGKTYAEISAAAMKDPQNEKLQQQKQTMFQGETLRGILLGTGYAYGTIGRIATIAGWVLLVSATVLILLGVVLSRKA